MIYPKLIFLWLLPLYTLPLLYENISPTLYYDVIIPKKNFFLTAILYQGLEVKVQKVHQNNLLCLLWCGHGLQAVCFVQAVD